MENFTPWRTFPIFISSTFADMQAERDYLKNVIFPKVEEELQQRRIKLEIVDLRWGVDTTSMEQEDEREASVLKVCLDEIRRCRPFFIGLLGDRYGWVPPLERMKTALVGETHINPEKGKSVTDLEIEFGVLASQEQLVRSVFYFRDALPYNTFSKKKAAMFSDAFNDELSGIEKAERKNALDILKTKIRLYFKINHQENKVKSYSGTWDTEKEKLTGLNAWGDIVYTDILAECESHAKDTWDKIPKNWQEQEIALLDAFIENNTSSFCGRKPLLETLKQHLLSTDTANWGLVLTGESGSGKSAVFSMMYKLMQQENCFILAHSAGLSPKAGHVADLLKIWIKQLSNKLGIKEEAPEKEEASDFLKQGLSGETVKESPIEKLQQKFTELLQYLSAKKRVVLLIDALDRFEPTARATHLSWLPAIMPQNVSMLCTAITGTEKKACQYHKGLSAKNIDTFSTAEAAEMLKILCLKQHKILNPNVQSIILDKKRDDGQYAISSPLWLSLAINMLMAIDLDDFEKIYTLSGSGGEQITTYQQNMAKSFDSLPGKLFISLIDKAGNVFGREFTKNIFDFIALSRNGLRENDLEALLTANNWDTLQFVNLRRWFKSHLIQQGEELQWNLAHSILRNTLAEKFDKSDFQKLHNHIAIYLMTLPENDTLHITETIYHLLEADQLEEAAVYYSGLLTKEEEIGATKILSGLITEEKGLEKALALMQLQTGNKNSFIRIIRRYIYSLYTELSIEGNLDARLVLIGGLLEIVDFQKKSGLDYEFFTWDLCEIYDTMGDIHMSMGRFEIALKYYQEEVDFIIMSHDKNPEEITIRYRLSQSYGSLGVINYEMGDIEKAKDNFQMQLGLLNNLNAENPNNEFVRLSIAYTLGKLGSIYMKLGDFDKALEMILSRLERVKLLSDAFPNDGSLEYDLATSYLGLGELYNNMGEPKKALDNFLLGFKFAQANYKANPNNTRNKELFAIASSNLGTFYETIGRPENANNNFLLNIKLRKELFEANPSDVKLKFGFALSYLKLGNNKKVQNDLEQALFFSEMGILLLKEIHDTNPTYEEVKQDLASYYSKISTTYLALGQSDKYIEATNAEGILMAELYEANPTNEENKRGLARSYILQGLMQWYLGEQEKAIGFLKLNCTFLEELILVNSKNIYLKKDLSVSYSTLGRFYQGNRNMEKSLEFYRKNLELCKEISFYYPEDESVQSNLLTSYLINGKLNFENKNFRYAIGYYENLLNVTTILLKDNEANPRFLKVIIEALYWLSKLYGIKMKIFKSIRTTKSLMNYISIMKQNDIELDDWMNSNKLFKKYWDLS